MPVKRLYNRISLRELFDKSPDVDPSFEKGHSFIFPGDKITFCTQLDALSDIENTYSGVIFQSVKCSIIAKKPNVFTEEFNSIFASTRSFELESFTIPLNNSNAPVVPFAGIGYAPKINFTQDRNWQLAAGDFHRQIKFATNFTPGVSYIPNTQPNNLVFPITVLSNGTQAFGTFGSHKAVGLADWAGDLNTTMLLLVDSINNNINHGTFTGYLTSFGNDLGFTASWDNINRQLTIMPPANIGATLNGIAYQIFQGYTGLIPTGCNLTWSGGITKTGTPPSLKYNFWYPVVFREEYWLALANADNDFYDNTLPQNGQNQKWLRYHDLSALPFGWQVKFRFELNYSKFGVQNRIYSELNLSNEQLGINDYNSNSDYILKSIKTCSIGGTPANTPFCPVYGDKNTDCFAYFTKNTAWDDNEQGNLQMEFRIRPQESGDQSAWNSTLSNPSVFIPISQHIKTNSGVRIKTNSGKQLITNQPESGNIHWWFDPLDHKNIFVHAQIDFNKLKAVYPGVTQFTFYCREVNKTIYTT